METQLMVTAYNDNTFTMIENRQTILMAKLWHFILTELINRPHCG